MKKYYLCQPGKYPSTVGLVSDKNVYFSIEELIMNDPFIDFANNTNYKICIGEIDMPKNRFIIKEIVPDDQWRPRLSKLLMLK